MEPDMENYKILTLGTSGAGKTVFLASMFKALSTQGEEGFPIDGLCNPSMVFLARLG